MAKVLIQDPRRTKHSRLESAVSSPPSSKSTPPSKGGRLVGDALAGQRKNVNECCFSGRRKCREIVPASSIVLAFGDCVKRYCKPHEKKQLRNATGFYCSKNGRILLVKFEDYIGDDLSPKTKTDLRNLMVKPLSDTDSRGYVYAFEVLGTGGTRRGSQKLTAVEAVESEANLGLYVGCGVCRGPR